MIPPPLIFFTVTLILLVVFLAWPRKRTFYVVLSKGDDCKQVSLEAKTKREAKILAECYLPGWKAIIVIER